MVNTRIRGDRGGLDDDGDIVGGRPETAAVSGELAGIEPWRLARNRHLERVLQHRRRGGKKPVRELAIVVLHGQSLADIGHEGFLRGRSPEVMVARVDGLRQVHPGHRNQAMDRPTVGTFS